MESTIRNYELWIPAILLVQNKPIKKIAPMTIDKYIYENKLDVARLPQYKRKNLNEDEFDIKIYNVTNNYEIYVIDGKKLGDYILKHNYNGVQQKPNLDSLSATLYELNIEQAWIHRAYRAGNKIGWLHITNILNSSTEQELIYAYVYNNL